MATLLGAVGVGAVTAGYISAAASAISVAMAVATPIMAAQQQKKEMKQNAMLLDQQARDKAVAGQMAAEKARRRNRQIMAEQTAGAAESGALSGTSLDLLDQNSVALEMNALTVAHNYEVSGAADANKAARLRADSKGVMAGGIMKGIGGGLSASGLMTSGWGKTAAAPGAKAGASMSSGPRVGTLLDPLNY